MAAAASSDAVVRGAAILAQLQPEFPDIAALDAKAAQCIAAGQVLPGLVCWERALFLRQHYLGHESAQVWAQARAMCEFCTSAARDALRCNDLESARRLLSKADALSTQDDELAIDILNHLACYYRRVAKYRVAYDYLKKAMAIDQQLHPPCSAKAAETRLNACAILSQLGRHDKAMALAQAALITLQGQAMEGATAGGQDAAATTVTNAIDNFAAQAVAHHNIAVEEEFLGKTAQSLHSYRRAAALAATHCGDSHPLTVELAKSLAAAEDALAQKKQHKIFKTGRDNKVKAVYGRKAPSPTKAHQAVPNATKKAYGVQPSGSSKAQVLQDELTPAKAVNMDQFEDAALADSFDVEVPLAGDSLAPVPLQDMSTTAEVATKSEDIVTLLTPRGSTADEGAAVTDPTAEAKDSAESQDENASTDAKEPSGDTVDDAKENADDNVNGSADDDTGESKQTNDAPEHACGDQSMAESKEDELDDDAKASSKDGDGQAADDQPRNDQEDDADEDDASQHDGGDQVNDLSDDEAKQDEGNLSDVCDQVKGDGVEKDNT